MAKAKKNSDSVSSVGLLNELLATPATIRRPNWFDRMEPSARQSLLEIRAAWQRGELRDRTIASVLRFLNERFPGQLPKHCVFSLWIKEGS